MLDTHEDNEENWHFEKLRAYLITQTAGFKILQQAFKEKHNLIKLHANTVKNRLVFQSLTDSDSYKDLEKISEELGLPKILLEDLVSGIVKNKGWQFNALPVYVSSGLNKLPEGYYVKIESYTSSDTITKSVEYIRSLREDVDKSADYSIKKFLPRLKQRSKSDLSKKLRFFKKVENNIFDFQTTDSNGYKSIVRDAITLADHDTYNLGFKKAKDIYYDILEYYKIPRYSDFMKLLENLSL